MRRTNTPARVAIGTYTHYYAVRRQILSPTQDGISRSRVLRQLPLGLLFAKLTPRAQLPAMHIRCRTVGATGQHRHEPLDIRADAKARTAVLPADSFPCQPRTLNCKSLTLVCLRTPVISSIWPP